MDPKYDGQTLVSRFFRRVDIEDVAFVTILHIGNVRGQLLGAGAAAKQEQRQNEGNDPEIYCLDSL